MCVWSVCETVCGLMGFMVLQMNQQLQASAQVSKQTWQVLFVKAKVRTQQGHRNPGMHAWWWIVCLQVSR